MCKGRLTSSCSSARSLHALHMHTHVPLHVCMQRALHAFMQCEPTSEMEEFICQHMLGATFLPFMCAAMNPKIACVHIRLLTALQIKVRQASPSDGIGGLLQSHAAYPSSCIPRVCKGCRKGKVGGVAGSGWQHLRCTSSLHSEHSWVCKWKSITGRGYALGVMGGGGLLAGGAGAAHQFLRCPQNSV